MYRQLSQKSHDFRGNGLSQSKKCIFFLRVEKDISIIILFIFSQIENLFPKMSLNAY